MVVKRGLNDSEIIPMATFCKEQGLELRFIEFMDVGSTNGWKMDDVVTKKQIHELLKEHFEFEPMDAAYYGEVARGTVIKGRIPMLVLLHQSQNHSVSPALVQDCQQMGKCSPVYLMAMATI